MNFRRRKPGQTDVVENKTSATRSSVDGYLVAIGDDARRCDCEALAKLMTTASGHDPVMWGAGIVGFGRHHYKYDSGREGESCLAGFSSRKGDISLSLSGVFTGREEFLAKLGRHKPGKACVYIRKLSDVDTNVLAQMVTASVAHRKRNNEPQC